MLTESRIHNEIFQDWKAHNPNTTWRMYWDNQLRDCISLYEKYDWKLLCIAKNNKIPVKGVHWTKRELSYDNTLILFQEKMNIAVDLAKSNLIICDIDNRIIPEQLEPFMNKTISIISPHGYHIYFNYDKSIDIKSLCKKFNRENMFRGGNNKNQYVLVPLSCVDKKYYEFINTSNLMNFSELIEGLK